VESAAAVVVLPLMLRTQEWNGEFFERRSLSALGLVIQLGHPVGTTCMKAQKGHKDFVLIDVTGIHTIVVNFCQCDTRLEKRQQLMRVCWWPVTARNPQTCATFAVVRLFRMLNCLGKVSAHDFLRSLELLTNNDGLSPVPVHVERS
jgi:CxC2 like cysteine cluster associated with KDZ transposases